MVGRFGFGGEVMKVILSKDKTRVNRVELASTSILIHGIGTEY